MAAPAAIGVVTAGSMISERRVRMRGVPPQIRRVIAQTARASSVSTPVFSRARDGAVADQQVEGQVEDDEDGDQRHAPRPGQGNQASGQQGVGRPEGGRRRRASGSDSR
jgi:hypothetical protein